MRVFLTKYMDTASFAVASAPVPIALWAMDGMELWQAGVTFGFCWTAMDWVYGKVIHWLPIALQRPGYERWKHRISRITSDNPMIDYPFQIWVAFSMDEEFKQGGISQAKQAGERWLMEFPDKISAALNPSR